MDDFRKIGVIGRLGSTKVVETIWRIKKFLTEASYDVILEKEIAELMPGHNLQVATSKLLGEMCDLVIVVGGDGSMLGAARALAQSNTPVLGINRGRLGFLCDINPEDVEKDITDVLDGNYITDSRFLLEAEIKRNGEPIGEGDALNDIVLHPGKASRMISFELFIEGQFVYSQKSDGLIVSTPTGSTAYALSGGGPIMHPKLDALVLVPMFPHTLSSRPIVVDGSSEIKIIVDEQVNVYPHVTMDGQQTVVAAPGDSVSIRKKRQKLKLIHPANHNFYETCRTKLGWGSRLGD